MIHIKAEGTQFDYVPANSAATVIESTWSIPPEEAFGLATGQDTRLSRFRDLLSSSRQCPYWLVWQRPTNLLEIDSRAEMGNAEDRDFADAFRAIVQPTRCSQCEAEFRTLIIDPGDPYPDAPTLLQRKIARLEIKRCPKCGGSFRQLVAKVLDAPPSAPSCKAATVDFRRQS
jgi:predicted Zn-ribbon and HTH transcriptional regulator